MSLTFLSPPRISAALFAQVLQQAKSPAAPEAFKLYDACATAGVDPAVALAFFKHESSFGTAGINVGYTLRNWGCVRTPYNPAAAISIIAVPNNGSFAKYVTWTRGLQDWCDRIRLRYVAHGYDTVEKAIPIYAPAADNNDEHAYIAAVEAAVAGWMAEEANTQMAAPTTGFADRTQLLPPGGNRPGDKRNADHAFITHETDNEAPTANAQMHFLWLKNSQPPASFHFCTDSAESQQFIPTDEIAWDIGDGADQPATDESYKTVCGEICVNDRAGYPVAVRRMAKVAARWLHSVGLQVMDGVTLRKHGSYPETTHRLCPKHLNAGDWGVTWADYVAMVKAEYTLLYVVNYPQLWGAKHPEIPYNATFGFPTTWRTEYDAGRPLGAVLSPEFGDAVVWQVFEEGVLRLDKRTGAIRVLR